MDKTLSNGNLLADLEGGGIDAERDVSRDMALSDGQRMQLLSRIWSRFLIIHRIVMRRESSNKLCYTSMNLADVSLKNAEPLDEQKGGIMEKGLPKENPRKKSNRKSTKPPRPPKPLLLDAADQKLVREISELAMVKKARTEKLKAAKKMKTAKSSSSGGNACAMVITVIFCFIIILHGVFSKSSSVVDSHGPLMTAPGLRGRGRGEVSILYRENIPASNTSSPTLLSPN